MPRGVLGDGLPKIVISYRRDDAPGTVGWLHETLCRRYGTDSIFMDINQIQASTNFRKSIGQAMRRADVVLAIIGPRWRGQRDNGTARIVESEDWVRTEVETALQLDIPVIPVLVDNAQMPSARELPPNIQELASINAVKVDPGVDFHNHVDRLATAIDRILGPTRPQAVAPEPEPAAAAPSSPQGAAAAPEPAPKAPDEKKAQTSQRLARIVLGALTGIAVLFLLKALRIL